MYSALVFLVLVAGAFGADANVTKVQVTVYYETLCPDSQKFIKDQLYPLWEKMMDNINLTLIPYGKATMKKMNETTVFECHHGEEECFGNKVQSCILEGSMIPMQSNKVKLINCLMTDAKKGTPYPTKSCAQKIGLTETLADELDKCANSTTGDEYLMKMGEMTEKFEQTLANVPTVRINNGERDKAAVSDLMSAVCGKFAANKPEICMKKNGANSIVAMALLPIAAAISVRVL